MTTSKSALLQPKFAMARGVLVLDENLYDLVEELEKRRFKVKLVLTGTPDEQIIDTLTHRIFVTNNPRDFVKQAPIEEFSIIDTTHTSKDAVTLATQISDAFIELELRSKQPFLLTLRRDGKSTLKLIE